MSFSDDDDASSTEQMIARSLGVPTSKQQRQEAQRDRGKKRSQLDSPESLSSSDSLSINTGKPKGSKAAPNKALSPIRPYQLSQDKTWSQQGYGHPQVGHAGGGTTAVVQPMELSQIEELAKAMAYAQSNLTTAPAMPWAAAPVVAPAARPAATAGAPAPSGGRRSAREFPHQLINFTFNERDRMEIFEEINSRDKKDPGPYRVASFISVGSPGSSHYHRFDLAKDLDSQGLRRLAMNFGCTNVGSLSMFACRRAMAAKVDLGTTYDNNTVPLPTSTANDRRVNTLCRLVNVVFLQMFRDRFIALNDALKRKQFESTAGGSNPIKQFWLEVSDYFNDSTNNSDIGALTYSGEDEDKHIHRFAYDQGINPNDFNQMTWDAAKQAMRDLMRARQNILVSIKVSGHHSNDAWDYCNRKHLTVRKNVVMPGAPVYYLDKMCEETPDIDQAYTEVLAEELRSSSNSSQNNDDPDGPPAAAASSRRMKPEDIIDTMKESSKELAALQAEANDQRGRMLELTMKKENDSLEAKKWDEYGKLANTMSRLRRAADTEEEHNEQLKLNFAKRIRALEDSIGIKLIDSIVRDIVE